MTGVGPLEPGEGTRARDIPDLTEAPRPGPRSRRPPRLTRSRRRTALTSAALAALLAGGGYLYATHEHQPPPQERQPPPLAPPFPAQVVDVSYLDPAPTPAGAAPGSFSFALLVSVNAGPPVTVTRIGQPYAGLSVTSAPRPPFRTRAGSARKIVVTMHVSECGTVPRNAGLPFLDVTLRNTRAMQVQSFILGSRYAQALSEALHRACDNDSR
ncbi:hypothetical protein [Streptomyces sp. NPDC003393]